MFEFYLCGAEIAFRRERHMVFQIQLAHRQTAVPLTRDYIAEFEAAATGRPKARVMSQRTT
jgi:cyclopropane-fatty-acyl-phospholipid synthase